MEILLLLTILATVAVGQDVLAEIKIIPDTIPATDTGKNIFLTCQYDKEIMKDVKWLLPDAKPITAKTKNAVLEQEAGAVSLTLEKVTVDVNGRYVCNGYSSRVNRTVAVDIMVDVYESVKIINLTKEQTVEQGKDIEVQCQVSGHPKPTVTWKRDNTKIGTNPLERIYQNPATEMLVIKNVSKCDEGYYTCTGRQRSKAQTTSVEIFVDIQYGPAGIEVPPKVYGVDGKEDVVVTCNSTAEPQPTYTWYKGGVDAVNNSSPITEGVSDDGKTLTLVKATSADAGQYTCKVSNLIATQFNFTEVVIWVPPVIVSKQNATANESSPASISCSATGTPTPTVVIKRSGVTIKSSEATDPSPVVAEYTLGSATVSFDAVIYSDNGDYSCEANNTVGKDEAVVSLNVRYAPRDANLPVVYACTGQPAQISCFFNANPAPELTWGVVESQVEDTTVLPVTTPRAKLSLEEILKNFTQVNKFGFLSAGVFVPMESTDNVATSNEDGKLFLKVQQVSESSYGKYYCQATNELGSKVAATELKEATVPSPPSNVQVIGISTQSATVTFSPPANVTVPIVSYLVEAIETQTAGKQSVIVLPESPGSSFNRTFKNLNHDTEYTISITAENCQGLGMPASSAAFRTAIITIPKKVGIVSARSSAIYNEYILEWQERGAGGGKISSIKVKYWPEDMNQTEASKETTRTIKSTDKEFSDQTLTITDLQPDTKYNVEITVFNEVGSASARASFSTPSTQKQTMVYDEGRSVTSQDLDTEPGSQSNSSVPVETSTWTDEFRSTVWEVARAGRVDKRLGNASEPTEAPKSSTGVDLNMGASNGLLVGVIVAVFLVVLLVIDISCCISRQWGLLYCIYSSTCGSATKDSTNLDGKDAEEGSAEFRKDNKADEVANVASSDTQPLTDEAEPIANGSQQEHGIVTEETPLNGEQAVNGENSTAAKTPLMEKQQPTPANSPMDASAAEAKTPLKAEDVAVAVDSNGQTSDVKETPSA